MEFEVDEALRTAADLPGLTVLRTFRWGRALSGTYALPPLAGSLVLVLQDTTGDAPRNTWRVFESATDLAAAETQVMGYGGGGAGGSAPVPAEPVAPRGGAPERVSFLEID